ncbi:hypothetical protein [Candidatus Protochlamydia phocaeensis]|uniref:hypothetical protein n=1 Tax=Candidatus Protochlamydia phocaeensis TaxID=1414722 RepID=UPI0008395AB9|nr:hypothetical protein [Candidatus Protochlamydia phocaeensis]
METEISQIRSKKVQHFWDHSQIFLAAYLAGPIGGCYFLGRNYMQSGQPAYARLCYAAGLLGLMGILTILAFIPTYALEHIPKSIIPISYSAIIAGFAYGYQKNLIEEQVKEGNKRFSYWWCLLIILSLLIVQIPLIFLYTIFLSSISS